MPRLDSRPRDVSTERAHAVVRSPRSNSFNLVPVRDVPRGAGAPCPVREQPEHFDRGRSLFLRLRDRMRLFETRTADFSEEELLDVRERGQLYADVSTKLAPDDFERDLRKLEPAAECLQCHRRSSCGQCWAPGPANVFAEDRRRVEEILGGLRGSILDVGCGEGPYLRALKARVEAGEASYLGVDPDRARVSVLGSRHPWATYFAGDLLELVEARGSDLPQFRHVLVLRSYNHLPDPARTLDLALSLLEPGGTLLVVDNVAFGLVRSAEQAVRAERGTATFEHFRNDGLRDVTRLLERPDVRLLEARDVTPRGSNEWLAHYQNTKDDCDDRRA